MGLSFKNILIIKPGAIGDLLHLTPVIRVLRRIYPGARVTVLVSSKVAASLFTENPLVAETIIYDRKGEHRSWSAFLELGRRIREGRFDLVLNFQRSNLKSWLLVAAAAPSRVLVYHKARRRTIHAIVNHLETLRPLGIEPAGEEPRLDFYPSAADRRFASDFFSRHGLDGVTVVAFNPGTSHLCKCWPVDRFAFLGDRLADELGARIVILGSRDEKELADGIAAGMRHPPLDLAGCTLGELGAVLERVPLLVTGDTGPMHIAAAVGTPVVALYGPISPERSGPLGGGHRIVMHGELACCPCNSFRCRNKVFRECMEMITVDEVFSAIREILGASETSERKE
jgi:heptosyltransferase-2